MVVTYEQSARSKKALENRIKRFGKRHIDNVIKIKPLGNTLYGHMKLYKVYFKKDPSDLQ